MPPDGARSELEQPAKAGAGRRRKDAPTTDTAPTIRGYVRKPGKWGGVTEEEACEPILNRLPAKVLRMREIGMALSVPEKGFEMSAREWAKRLEVTERHMQRLTNYVEALGLFRVNRSGGGPYDEVNTYLLLAPPKAIPEGLTIRGGQRGLARARSGAARASSSTPEASAAAPTQAGSPPPVSSTPAQAKPARRASEERFAGVLDAVSAWELPAPGPALLVAYRARVEELRPAELDIADLYIDCARTGGEESRANLWAQLEQWQVVEPSSTPARPLVWDLAAEESAARVGADVERAAEELVVGFHILFLRCAPDYGPLAAELGIARQLLEAAAGAAPEGLAAVDSVIVRGAWKLLGGAVARYVARRQSSKGAVELAKHLHYLARDIRREIDEQRQRATA
jgi:hypothetical protein